MERLCHYCTGRVNRRQMLSTGLSGRRGAEDHKRRPSIIVDTGVRNADPAAGSANLIDSMTVDGRAVVVLDN